MQEKQNKTKRFHLILKINIKLTIDLENSILSTRLWGWPIGLALDTHCACCASLYWNNGHPKDITALCCSISSLRKVSCRATADMQCSNKRNCCWTDSRMTWAHMGPYG